MTLFITACRWPAAAGQLEPVLGYHHLLHSRFPFAASEGAAGLDFRLGWGGDPGPLLSLAVGHCPCPRLPLRAEPAGNEMQQGPEAYPVGCSLEGLNAILSPRQLCTSTPFVFTLSQKYLLLIVIKPCRSSASLGWALCRPLEEPAHLFGVLQISAKHPRMLGGEDLS